MPCEEGGHFFVADELAAIGLRHASADGCQSLGIKRLSMGTLRNEIRQNLRGFVLPSLR